MVLAVSMRSGQSFVTSAPNIREVRVVCSPQLQPHITSFAAGSTEIPPGQSSSMHHHTNSEELWLVVSGEGEVNVGGERIHVTADTLILVPRRVEHQISNLGGVPLKVYWFFIPPGPERNILRGRLE